MFVSYVTISAVKRLIAHKIKVFVCIIYVCVCSVYMYCVYINTHTHIQIFTCLYLYYIINIIYTSMRVNLYIHNKYKPYIFYVNKLLFWMRIIDSTSNNIIITLLRILK